MTITAGPAEAEPAPRRGWIGRGAALAAAVMLVGGGGYLAVNAGAANGGAETPEGALDGALAALSTEDFVGAAEFVEPAERDTMVDAGFDVIDELIRLEVFDESLDLGSVEGIDLEFTDVEIDAIEVQPGLAHLFITGGTATTSLDGSAVPLGALITDRVDADTLAVTEQSTEQLTRAEQPIVAVERNGRWYLSLWYSVAENARLEMGAPLPNPADRLAEIGAATPEGAVENFVRATERLDLATMVGMLDPQEMAVLYDYGSLFVGDAQDAADGFLDFAADEGWSWEITELDLRADTDGDLATVVIERLDVVAGGPGASFEISYTGDRVIMSFEVEGAAVDVVAEGDCVTVSVDEGRGVETDETCAGDLLSAMGLGSITSPGLTGAGGSGAGIIVREVDGRWYLSPIRTGSALVVQSLQALDAEALAETVDSLTELFRDPFGGAFFDDEFLDDEFLFEIDEYPVDPPDELDVYPEFSDENVGLLADGPDFVFVYDLVAGARDEFWSVQFPDAVPQDFDAGVVGQAVLAGNHHVEIGVLQGLVFETDEELAAWVGGTTVVTDDGFTYVDHVSEWGIETAIARTDDGIAFVATYSEFHELSVDALRNQVGG
ncbi:MAG: hypothetical protein RIB98_15745 [Acidimicrobiales bacterium]